MPWSGAGSYSLPPAYSPEVNGTVIDATRYNGLTSDVASGITACLAKNGENVPTANLPMGGFKHTGAAVASASGQYLVYGQTGGSLTGTFSLDSGSAAAPSLNFSASTTTGLYRAGADQLGFTVAGSASGVWTATGFGVGTTSPLGRLHVQSNSGQDLISIFASGSATGNPFIALYQTTTRRAYLQFLDSDDSLILNNEGGTVINLATSGSNRWSVAPSFVPALTGTYSIGSSTLEVLNVFSQSVERNSAGALILNSSNAAGTIDVRVAGSSRWVWTAAGHLQPSATATYNLGAVGAEVASAFVRELRRDSAGALQLNANDAAGTVTVGTVGATRWTFISAGHFTPGVDAGYDVGAAASRVRVVYGSVFSDGATGTSALVDSSGATARIASGSSWTALQLLTGGVVGLQITSDRRVFGTALHNNAGSVTGTTNQYLASGTYTPTFTSLANIGSTLAQSTSWIRVGNVVHVTGAVSVDPTSASTYTSFGISLPIASNLVSVGDLAGTAVRDLTFTSQAIAGSIVADGLNERATLSFFCDADAAVRIWYFTFSYVVL